MNTDNHPLIYNKISGIIHFHTCGRVKLMNSENILFMDWDDKLPDNAKVCIHCVKNIKEHKGE